MNLIAVLVFGDEIRTQISYAMRAMSVVSWNKQNDIKSALALIDYALMIEVDEDVKEKFRAEKITLEKIKKQRESSLPEFVMDDYTIEMLSKISENKRKTSLLISATGVTWKEAREIVEKSIVFLGMSKGLGRKKEGKVFYLRLLLGFLGMKQVKL